MIKAIIFDWGGVIAPSPGGGWANVLANKLGLNLEQTLTHWKSAGYADFSKGLIDEHEFWRQFEESYGRVLTDDEKDIWEKGSALNPWPDMLKFIKELKEKNMAVAVLSNTVRPMSKLARRAHLYDLFTLVVLSNEVGLIKPGVEIYQYTVERLSLNANECIYVDDLPQNLIPAAELGMKITLANGDYKKTINNINDLMAAA